MGTKRKATQSLGDRMIKETNPEKDKELVNRVSELAELAMEEKSAIEDLEEELKTRKKELEKLLRESIPDAMRTSGLESFSTTDWKITLHPKVYANISEKNWSKALSWLRKHNYGSMVKNVLSFQIGNENQQTQLEAFATEMEFPYDSKQSIHASTLKAFIANLRKERGEAVKPSIQRLNPPVDVFGIYEYTEAKITRR
jgi:hypothetical protein